MRFEDTELPGVVLVTPDVHRDTRGYMYEAHQPSFFDKLGVRAFVQSNVSTSGPGALRGLHYQAVDPQGKLVRAVMGAVYDVAVDLRRGSPTFGRWVGRRLDAATGQALWVPPGFAHGFLSLGASTVVYECSSPYVEEHARAVRWDDPEIGVGWPLSHGLPIGQRRHPVLSPRDISAPLLHDVVDLPVTVERAAAA